jgi:hypothetical protein
MTENGWQVFKKPAKGGYKYVILQLETDLKDPHLAKSNPLSKEAARTKLRELGVEETEIEAKLDDAATFEGQGWF